MHEGQGKLRVLSWNIRAIRGIGQKRLSKIVNAICSKNPCIIILQEVSCEDGLPERLRTALSENEYSNWYYSAEKESAGKKYGNVIASQLAVEPSSPKSPVGAPWPQLLAFATVTTPKHSIEVIGVHIPNGSRNGWKKIETYEVLRAEIEGRSSMPLIVAGDFNEPRELEANGGMITFGADRGGSIEGLKRHRIGGRHPRERWHRAVVSVIGKQNSAISHAWLSQNPGKFVATHVVRGKERFFDHILFSDHFQVTKQCYEKSWRLRNNGEPLSDHSAAIVDLVPRGTVKAAAR